MAKANPIRFSTKYQDDESDLVCYPYRYYNASTAKWLSRDPIDETAFKFVSKRANVIYRNEEKNPYCFVRNDPLSKYDSLGLEDVIYWPPPVEGNCNSDDVKSCRAACAARGLALIRCNVTTTYTLIDYFDNGVEVYEKYLWTRTVTCSCKDPRSCPPPYTGGRWNNPPPWPNPPPIAPY
jgi:RHS repeat-associated protein